MGFGPIGQTNQTAVQGSGGTTTTNTGYASGQLPFALQQPVSVAQTAGAEQGAQGALNQQQNFVNALQNQGALNAQSNIFNQLQGVAGQQQGLYGQQQGLANQLQNMVQGGGPNPAANMLQAAQNQNNQMAAGTIAGTKGLSPALAAQLAGQQSVTNNQTAANQAAQIRQQQQLGAISALQGQQQNLGGTLGAIGGTLNAGGNMATTQAQQLQNAIANQSTSAQGLLGQYLGANNAFNQANLGAGQLASGYATGMAGAQNQGLGGVLGGVGSALATIPKLLPAAATGAAALAKGGKVPSNEELMAHSQQQQQQMPQQQLASAPQMGGPQSYIGQYFAGSNNPRTQQPTMSMFSHGGQAKQQRGFNPTGKQPIIGEHLAAKGMKVPGQAKVSGDDEKNDIVPALLSPGEVVIPRSVMNSDDPAGKSAKFVSAVMAKHKHASRKK